jgi:hypothetical protein
MEAGTSSSGYGTVSGGFASKKFVLLLAATIGATEAAKEQHGDAGGDEHRE